MFVVSFVINGMEEGQGEDDIAKQDYTIEYTQRVITKPCDQFPLQLVSLRQPLINCLMRNPGRVLAELIELEKNFYKQSAELFSTRGNVIGRELIEIYRKNAERCIVKNPLFLVQECSGEECNLSRKENPRLREVFEERVVAFLKKHHEDKKGVNYVDFGSGYGFSVVVSLVKFLVQEPKAKMTIHWIDTEYTPFVVAKNRREVDLKTVDPTTTSGGATYAAGKRNKRSQKKGFACIRYCCLIM